MVKPSRDIAVYKREGELMGLSDEGLMKYILQLLETRDFLADGRLYTLHNCSLVRGVNTVHGSDKTCFRVLSFS